MIEVTVKDKPVDIVITQVYMSATTHEDEELDYMYEIPENLDRIKVLDCVVIMGGWNAVVGRERKENVLESTAR